MCGSDIETSFLKQGFIVQGVKEGGRREPQYFVRVKVQYIHVKQVFHNSQEEKTPK